MNRSKTENKVLDLKMKIIELKHEKEKDVHKSGFSILFGLIVFLITSGVLSNAFNVLLKGTVEVILQLEFYIAVISLIVILTIPAIIAGIFANRMITYYLKSREKIYDEWIYDIEKLINNLDPKKE